MSTELIKAAKQALEALEAGWPVVADLFRVDHVMQYEAAITALRQALQSRSDVEQQPAQVTVKDFVATVQGKEHLNGKPAYWAQWPNENALAAQALDKMAENARELGLSYEDWGPGPHEVHSLKQQPAERLELIGHADLNINNIYIFNGYGEDVPEGRTPIYAGYKEQPAAPQRSEDKKQWVNATTWRGLTDGEIQQYVESRPYYGHCNPEYREGIEEGARWADAKLRAVNGFSCSATEKNGFKDDSSS